MSGSQNKYLSGSLRFFRSVSLLLTIGAAIWLFLCLVASIWNVSERPSYISFFSFSNVFAVFVNGFFAVFWLFSTKRWYALIPVLSLAICYPIVRSSFGFRLFGIESKNEEGAGLKVMTWNVHLFDLGEWTKNKQSKNRIIEFIEQQEPDILCLQEYYYDVDNPNEPYTEILRGMGYAYYEFASEGKIRKKRLNIAADAKDRANGGTAVFSKFPLSNAKVYDIDRENNYYNMLGVDVILGSERTIRLYTTHLQSATLNRNDIELVEAKRSELSTKVDRGTKGVLSKLMHTASKRAAQADLIDSILKKNNLPQVICGDFNDMPGSYVYRKIKGDRSDAFVDKGFGFGRTYTQIFPTLRIDYIFYDSDFFECQAYSSPYLGLSDHNPVIATFAIKEAGAE